MLNISKPPVLRQVVLGLTLAAASALTLAAPTGQGQTEHNLAQNRRLGNVQHQQLLQVWK
jgi:hypothetical protein